MILFLFKEKPVFANKNETNSQWRGDDYEHKTFDPITEDNNLRLELLCYFIQAADILVFLHIVARVNKNSFMDSFTNALCFYKNQ